MDHGENKHHFPQSSNFLPYPLSGEINSAAEVKLDGFFKKVFASSVVRGEENTFDFELL